MKEYFEKVWDFLIEKKQMKVIKNVKNALGIYNTPYILNISIKF